MSDIKSNFKRGPRLSIDELKMSVGNKYINSFKFDVTDLEKFRDSIHDWVSYPASEDENYPIEQLNFTYILSMIDVIRVQMFDVDPNYQTLTYGINNATISEPLYTTDMLTMICTIKDVKVRGERVWMTTGYEIFKFGSDKPSVKSELISCLIKKP